MYQNTVVNYLQKEFDKRKQRNESYSLRAYARNLGLSPGFLSQVLSHKKQLTPKALCAIAPSLNLSNETLEELIHLQAKIAQEKKLLQQEEESAKTIDMETFSIIADWYHYAILHLFQLDDYLDSPEWVAQKLGLTIETAALAIERMVALNLLSFNAEGVLEPTYDYMAIKDYNFSSVAMRERQKQILELSAEKIDLQSIESRDHSAITVPIDPDLLPEIKDKISKFRKGLGRYIVKNSKNLKSVYELQISFFSISDCDKELQRKKRGIV